MPYYPDSYESALRREKKKARDLRKTEWWKRQCAKGRCYYCKNKISPHLLTMDHIIPISRGGETYKGNVVPACKSCNNQKKSLLTVEWEQYIQSIIQTEDTVN